MIERETFRRICREIVKGKKFSCTYEMMEYITEEMQLLGSVAQDRLLDFSLSEVQKFIDTTK